MEFTEVENAETDLINSIVSAVLQFGGDIFGETTEEKIRKLARNTEISDIARQCIDLPAESFAVVAPALAVWKRVRSAWDNRPTDDYDHKKAIAAHNAALTHHQVNDHSAWGGNKIGNGGDLTNQYSNLPRRTR